MNILFAFLLFAALANFNFAFLKVASNDKRVKLLNVFPNFEKQQTFLKETSNSEDLEETTKKYGLEVGLWKAFTSKNSSQKIKPGDLLKKYGANLKDISTLLTIYLFLSSISMQVPRILLQV